MDLHSKIVGKPELEFYKISEEHGISPPIISVIEIDEGYQIQTKEYPQTLCSIPLKERYKLSDKIKNLVDRFHTLGIYHGDIKEDNIVCDSIDGVRIIDFGLSKWICNLCEKDLKNNMYMFDEIPAESVEILLNLELKECDFICGT